MTIHYPNNDGLVARCGKCGAILENGAMFCQECGAKAEASGADSVKGPALPVEALEIHLKHVETLVDSCARLQQGEVTVGRSEAQSQLVVKGDPSISRQQCRLTVEGQALILENVSANGTMVNGQTLTAGQTAALKQGDVIGMGNGNYTISWRRVRTWRGF